jgi:hypothetical protein
MSLSANTMPDFELRQLVEQLTKERDAALATAEKANTRWIEMTKVAGEAEQLGYQRGVREAAKVARDYLGPNSLSVPAILALLEPSLSPEDKPT